MIIRLLITRNAVKTVKKQNENKDRKKSRCRNVVLLGVKNKEVTSQSEAPRRSQGRPQDRESNPQPCYCEATVLTAAQLCQLHHLNQA